MTEQGKKNIVWSVFAAFMLFGIGGMIATHKPWSPETAGKELAQGDIKFCWEQYDRKLIAPSENLKVAAKCIELEKSYFLRFNESFSGR